MDQRLTRDIERLCNDLSALIPSMVKPVVDILWCVTHCLVAIMSPGYQRCCEFHILPLCGKYCWTFAGQIACADMRDSVS